MVTAQKRDAAQSEQLYFRQCVAPLDEEEAEKCSCEEDDFS